MSDQRDSGWPLLTVETEVVNGDSKRTNYRGPSLVSSLDSSCRYNRFCPALAALVSPVLNIIFLTFSLYYCLSPAKLGRQACWITCLCEWQTSEQQFRSITRSSEIQKLRNFDAKAVWLTWMGKCWGWRWHLWWSGNSPPHLYEKYHFSNSSISNYYYGAGWRSG